MANASPSSSSARYGASFSDETGPADADQQPLAADRGSARGGVDPAPGHVHR